MGSSNIQIENNQMESLWTESFGKKIKKSNDDVWRVTPEEWRW